MVAECWSNGAISEQLVITMRAVENGTSLDLFRPSRGEPEHLSRRVKVALLFLAARPGSTPSVTHVCHLASPGRRTPSYRDRDV